jgi:NADP-dependent 3-hydroxy acid dehydrogenase YdfG
MVVAITGASAGIGRALAEALSHKGVKLALAARRLDRLQELNQQLGGQHFCVQADVSIPGDCESFINQTVQHFGRIDTLVCNAGYGIARSVVNSTHDDVERMFATNVYGTLDCIRAAVPLMQKQDIRDGYRGQVMIVSSAAGRRGLPFFGIYSATKFAQLGISEALRVELKPDQIAVTSIHPIGTETEFFGVAQEQGGLKMPPPGTGEVRQSASTVARKMMRAIERPRPEVWPMRPARWALSFATLFPGITDRVMGKYRGGFDDKNPKETQ